MKKDILLRFYRSVIESILTFSIIIWFDSITVTQRKKLNTIVRTANRITGCELPSLESLYLTRTQNRAKKIVDDVSHPASHIFQMLPSGRRYRSVKAGTTRTRNSFFPRAVNILNS